MRHQEHRGAAGGRISSPYGTPEQPRWPRERRRRGLGLLPVLLLPFGIGAAVVGGVLAAQADPTITLQPGLGLAVTPARQVALVPYERDGEVGVFGMFGGDPWQKRLAAVDLASGDRLWDVKLSDGLVWQATVLVAGDTHAYLATDDGLMIVDLSDGSLAVEPGEIPGIGGGHIASAAAYGYDSVRQAVVAMDVQGGFHTIPVGELAASPADRQTSAAWTGRLSDGALTLDEEALTADAASAGEAGSLTLKPTTDGAPGGTLLLTDREGRQRQLGGRPFREPEILLAGGTRVATGAPVRVDGDTSLTVEEFSLEIEELIAGGLPDEVAEQLQQQLEAALAAEAAGLTDLPGLPDLAALLDQYGVGPDGADRDGTGGVGGAEGAEEQSELLALGADRGHVLVQEAADAVGERYRLTVLSLATGEVLASHTMSDEAGQALTSPSGTSVLPLASVDAERSQHDGLLLLRPDGSLTEVAIGETDLLGNPD